MQMNCFSAQKPTGGDLRTLLATCTMQSVRCAVFGVTRAITGAVCISMVIAGGHNKFFWKSRHS